MVPAVVLRPVFISLFKTINTVHMKKKTSLALTAILFTLSLHAQDGNAGINQANTLVRSYFETAVNLLFAIGGIAGLVGAVKVFSKVSHGEGDSNKSAMNWFYACIFLVVVAATLRAFFGL